MVERRARVLKDGGIYCLALTPYQYAVHAVSQQYTHLAYILAPQLVGTINEAPEAFLLHDGSLVTREGYTGYTASDLDFTGRYLS